MRNATHIALDLRTKQAQVSLLIAAPNKLFLGHAELLVNDNVSGISMSGLSTIVQTTDAHLVHVVALLEPEEKYVQC